MKILLVECDGELCGLISTSLTLKGFLVDTVETSEDACNAITMHDYNVAILERNLPDGDGLELLQRFRNSKQALAIMMLSAMGGAANRIKGLDAGADDYMEKPFDMNELAARLRAIGRRPRELGAEVLNAGDIHFNISNRTAHTSSHPIKLSQRETALLEQFMRRPGVTVLRERLEQSVYGFDEAYTPNALEAHISRLRGKLKAAGAGVEIHAIHGIGYLMKEANVVTNIAVMDKQVKVA